MNFMKRAFLYLGRKKGRTLTLAFLLFFMSCFVLVGISFQKSTEKEMDRLRQSLASGFTLKVNTQNELYRGSVDYGNGISGYDYTGPMITEEMIEKICSVDGVKDYNVNVQHTAWADLKLRPGMYADELEHVEHLGEIMTDPPTKEELMCWGKALDLYPCRNGSLHKNFRSGALTIVEGRNIKPSDRFKAVISDWLAKNNHLSVGDTITFESKEGSHEYFPKHPMETIGVPVEVEIVGVFHSAVSFPESTSTLESSYIENVVYVDMNTYMEREENLEQFGYEGLRGLITVEFMVEDPRQLDSIMQQVKHGDELDLENMELEVDETAYQATARPYRQIHFFAILLLIVGLCGIGSILYLVLKLWVQGRKHEIGILYSIGIKRGAVLAQLLTECLLVSAAALLLTFILSGPIVTTCAATAERLTAPKEDAEAYRMTLLAFDPVITKTSSDEAVLERVVSGDAVLFMALFVCGISGISVIASFVGVNGLKRKRACLAQML